MAGTFSDFIAWPDRDEVVLVELAPSLTLSGFAAVGGGAQNSYQIAVVRFVSTDLFPKGGVYRKVVGVRENGTDLTERTSLATVDANASSWWWDSTNDLLYVRSSTGSDPDTFTAYQAFVTFYCATKGLVLNQTDGNGDTGVYYHPWMAGEAPRASAQMEDLLFGHKIAEAGDLVLTNAHEFWNAIVAPNGSYNWKNKKVKFFLGGSYRGLALARSQYVAVTTMLVEDVPRLYVNGMIGAAPEKEEAEESPSTRLMAGIFLFVLMRRCMEFQK